jgi:2-aminoethylphosphonate-pyruvate transaminase
MKSSSRLPVARDKLLFTPGPLTTSLSVKQAMLHDAGSWHSDFNETVERIRQELLLLAGLSREKGFEAVLMQGSGTFGVEAVLATLVPPTGKLLLLANGAYGERIVEMANHLRIPARVLRTAEDQTPDAGAVRESLAGDPALSHVAAVHCETTTGILNPIEALGRAVKEQGRIFIVDAMSSFGGVPIDFEQMGIDVLVSSPNKCLEGVPGFSFVLLRRDLLTAAEGWARSLSLDLVGQWKGFEKNGQFRYTPPTHSILAFEQALREFSEEGGLGARAARYAANHRTLVEGMKRLGFKAYLDPALQSHIITSFLYPEHPRFTFAEFYQRLNDKGFIIYPGKISQANTFRIGSIGRIFPADLEALLAAIAQTQKEMGLT